MPDDAKIDTRQSISHYYNASQFRADTWNRLKNITLRLAQDRARKGDTDAAIQILQELEPLETYWAFPGLHVFRQLHHLMLAKEYEDLATIITGIVGALMSGQYRRRHLNLMAPIEGGTLDDEDEENEIDERARRRPYFETLIVDDIPPHSQRQQRDDLVGMRRDEDAFTYEPVFVPSFEDALIAVLLNHNIQAVVIRYGFQLRSSRVMPVLERYLKQFQRLQDT